MSITTATRPTSTAPAKPWLVPKTLPPTNATLRSEPIAPRRPEVDPTKVAEGVRVTVAQRFGETITGRVAPVAAELGCLRVLWGAGWFDIPFEEISSVTLVGDTIDVRDAA